MKKVESPQDYVNRVLTESGLVHAKVAERAQKLGHKLSAGYVHNIARGTADNPSVQLMKALAAGLGRPEDEVVAVFRGKQITDENGYRESFMAVIWNELKELPTKDQKELKTPLDMLLREVQRRFNKT